MRYWSFNEPGANGENIVETFSDQEILDRYWDYWSAQKIAKYGRDEFEKNYWRLDCIDAWCAINGAWEST